MGLVTTPFRGSYSPRSRTDLCNARRTLESAVRRSPNRQFASQTAPLTGDSSAMDTAAPQRLEE